MSQKIKLGDRVLDSISGFDGVCTGRSEFLYGCVRCMVTPKGLHDGKPIEAQWFDEDQLVVLADEVAPGNPGSKRGGPRSDARRRSDVSR